MERAFLAEAAVHPGSGAGRGFLCLCETRTVSVLRGVYVSVYMGVYIGVCIGCVYLHVRQVCVYTGSVEGDICVAGPGEEGSRGVRSNRVLQTQ